MKSKAEERTGWRRALEKNIYEYTHTHTYTHTQSIGVEAYN